MVARKGLRAVAAGAPSSFRVFPEADGGHAIIGRRIGVHGPDGCWRTASVSVSIQAGKGKTSTRELMLKQSKMFRGGNYDMRMHHLISILAMLVPATTKSPLSHVILRPD